MLISLAMLGFQHSTIHLKNTTMHLRAPTQTLLQYQCLLSRQPHVAIASFNHNLDAHPTVDHPLAATLKLLLKMSGSLRRRVAKSANSPVVTSENGMGVNNDFIFSALVGSLRFKDMAFLLPSAQPAGFLGNTTIFCLMTSICFNLFPKYR